MIVVLSLNTAVDRTYLVRHFELGGVFRAENMVAEPGGKGINVARVLRRLDVPVRLVGLLGGLPTDPIRRGCEEMGIDARWVPIAGETRTCTIVVDGTSPHATVVNEEGPSTTASEVEFLVTEIERATEPGDVLSIAGSAPPGVPTTFYAEVIRAMRRKDVRVLVDAGGSLLRVTCEAHPWAVAPNYEETMAAFPGEVATPAQAARRLARTSDIALLTMGADGVLLDDSRDALRISPPRVTALNPVGSGDAFVAGFLAGIEDGRSRIDAVKWGIACGASNAARLFQGVERPDRLKDLVSAVEVHAYLPPTL